MFLCQFFFTNYSSPILILYRLIISVLSYHSHRRNAPLDLPLPATPPNLSVDDTAMDMIMKTPMMGILIILRTISMRRRRKKKMKRIMKAMVKEEINEYQDQDQDSLRAQQEKHHHLSKVLIISTF